MFGPSPGAALRLPVTWAHLFIITEALIFGLNTYALIVIYFFAVVTDGLINSLRILVVGLAGNPLSQRVGISGRLSRLVMSLLVLGFFWSKFGAALLTAGLLVFALPGWLAGAEGASIIMQSQQALDQHGATILLGSGALLLVQAKDFIFGFLAQGQFRCIGWAPLLFRPYFGLVATTLVLAASAFIATQQSLLAAESALAVLLVCGKLLTDLLARLRDPAIG